MSSNTVAGVALVVYFLGVGVIFGIVPKLDPGGDEDDLVPAALLWPIWVPMVAAMVALMAPIVLIANLSRKSWDCLHPTERRKRWNAKRNRDLREVYR